MNFIIIRIYSTCTFSAVYLTSYVFFCLKIKVIPLYASLWGTRRSCTSLVERTTLWPWPRSGRNPCICGIINDIKLLNVSKRSEHVDQCIVIYRKVGFSPLGQEALDSWDTTPHRMKYYLSGWWSWWGVSYLRSHVEGKELSIRGSVFILLHAIPSLYM